MKPCVTRELVARFARYHAQHPEIFHIVLDDVNIQHGHASYCLNTALDIEGIDLGRMLVAMSKRQRLKLAQMYQKLK